MREAAEPAVPAVRSIALMVWRADMASKTSFPLRSQSHGPVKQALTARMPRF
jgi:hypothetical protein